MLVVHVPGHASQIHSLLIVAFMVSLRSKKQYWKKQQDRQGHAGQDSKQFRLGFWRGIPNQDDDSQETQDEAPKRGPLRGEDQTPDAKGCPQQGLKPDRQFPTTEVMTNQRKRDG